MSLQHCRASCNRSGVTTGSRLLRFWKARNPTKPVMAPSATAATIADLRFTLDNALESIIAPQFNNNPLKDISNSVNQHEKKRFSMPFEIAPRQNNFLENTAPQPLLTARNNNNLELSQHRLRNPKGAERPIGPPQHCISSNDFEKRSFSNHANKEDIFKLADEVVTKLLDHKHGKPKKAM